MTNVIHYMNRPEKTLIILLINAEKTVDKLLQVPKLNMESPCKIAILLLWLQPKGIKTGIFFKKLLHECSYQHYLTEQKLEIRWHPPTSG